MTMKMIETGIKVDGQDLRMRPVDLKGTIILYDIYLGEAWLGSRRTVDACGMVFGIPDLRERLWG